MNKKIIMGSLLMGGFIAVAVSTIAFSEGEYGEWEDDEYGRYEESVFGRTIDVPPVTDKLYATECGSCHFAYQPGWLPQRSWRSIMGKLDEHFGENVELDDAVRARLTRYLVSHAADVQPNRMSRRVLRSLRPDETPLRISELAFIRHEHREIPRRMLEGNPKVVSRANCNACHTQAAKGIFNEHGVVIPGFGRYDD